MKRLQALGTGCFECNKPPECAETAATDLGP